MGFFSWKLSDTGESLANVYCEGAETVPVKLLSNDGRVWTEEAYEGYGLFGVEGSEEGCMDYYGLVDLMNGGTSDCGDRDRGIELAFSDDEGVALPKIVSKSCQLDWADLPPSPICGNQGYWL